MSRLIAACFVMIAAVAFAGAQPANDQTRIEPTFDENRQWVWKLPADGEIGLLDLLKLYADTRESVLIYDPKRIAGTISFRSPNETTLSGEQIDLFVANSLGEHRIAIVDAGGGQLKIMPHAELVTTAPIITVDQLETMAVWKWVSVRYHPANVEANGLRGTLQNLTSRQGGSVNPTANGDLLICDRTDRVRELVKLASEIDLAMVPEIRTHDVPEGVDVEKAVQALQQLLGGAAKHRLMQPSFTRSPSRNAVIVRGSAELHGEVVIALTAMK